MPIEDTRPSLRHGRALRTVRAADIPVLALEDPASGARDQLRGEIARALDEDRAEAIVLGCAGMADLAADLSAEFGVPVIDGVSAAVKLAEALVALGLSRRSSAPSRRRRRRPIPARSAPSFEA